MSIYTRTSADIFFLNDKNIVSSFEQDAAYGMNPIPSKDLLTASYEALSTRDDAICAYIQSLDVENGISTGGYILDSLTQEDGKLVYNVRKIISSDVSNLSEYVSDVVSSLTIEDITNISGIVSKVTLKNGIVNVLFKDILSDYVIGLPEYVKSKIDELDVNPISGENKLLFAASLQDGKISACYRNVTSSDFAENKLVTSQIDTLNSLLEAISSNYVKRAGDSMYGSLSVNGNISSDGNIIASNDLSAKRIHSSTFLEVGDLARANEYSSIALGMKSSASHRHTFVWNGKDEDYISKNESTFNINPLGGTEGFYIGNYTLCSILERELDSDYSDLTSKINNASVALSTDYCKKIKDSIDSLSAEVKANYALSNDVYSKIESDNNLALSITRLHDEISSNYALSALVYNKSEVNLISSSLSTAVHDAGYVTPYNFNFWYADSKIRLSIDNNLGSAGVKTFEVDTSDIELRRLLSGVAVGDSPISGKKALLLVFKLEDGSSKPIWIDIDSLAKIYTSGNGIHIADDLTISVTDYVAKSSDFNVISSHYVALSAHLSVDSLLNDKFSRIYEKSETSSDLQLASEFAKYLLTGNYALSSDVSNKIELSEEFARRTLNDEFYPVSNDVEGLKAYAKLLSGPEGTYIGIIPTISNDISTLYRNNVYSLKFINKEVLLTKGDWSSLLTSSISALLVNSDLAPGNKVYNGTAVKFIFGSDVPLSSAFITNDGLSIGNNDYVIFRDNENETFIDVSKLTISDPVKNVHVTNAIHSYDFYRLKDEYAKYRSDIKDRISSCWLSISDVITLSGYDMDQSEATSCVVNIASMISSLVSIM